MCTTPDERPGSILHWSGFERKELLHRLIQKQSTEVELVQAVVVRAVSFHATIIIPIYGSILQVSWCSQVHFIIFALQICFLHVSVLFLDSDVLTIYGK